MIVRNRENILTFSWTAETICRKDKGERDDIKLPTFDFLAISNATNHFSQSNKLGQGGFGPVYKVLKLYITQTFILMKLISLFPKLLSGHITRWARDCSEEAF